jgi:hypothetical protein
VRIEIIWMRKLLFTCCNIFFRLRGRGPVGPGAGGCHRCGQQGLQQQPAADRRTEAAPPPATRQVGYSTVQQNKRLHRERSMDYSTVHRGTSRTSASDFVPRCSSLRPF